MVSGGDGGGGGDGDVVVDSNGSNRLGGKTRESLELRKNHFCGVFVRGIFDLWGTEGAKGPQKRVLREFRSLENRGIPLRVAVRRPVGKSEYFKSYFHKKE